MLKLFQTYLGAFTSSWFMCSFDMVPFIILKGISLVSSTKRCSRFTCISSALTVKWKWSRSVVSDSAASWTVPARLIHPWDFPAKSTGVGCHFLLQGIFLTQGSNLGLLHCRQTPFCLSCKGRSWGSSQPRDRTQVSRIAGGFFTSWAP